jgi:hypothetical protein
MDSLNGFGAWCRARTGDFRDGEAWICVARGGVGGEWRQDWAVFLTVLRPAGAIQAHGSRRIKQYCESGRGHCKQRLEVGSVNNWHAGDVVVWDNCSTLHRRDGFDESARRIMHRTQMLGPLTV